MVLINKAINEVTVKLVYYGPGLCGKTTNLEQIYASPRLENKGKMISMATETDRTLFFDFMPLELGTIGGQKIRVQIYTVPGQVFYDATRKLVLRGADGVVFVADSQPSMRDSNIESLQNLKTNLRLNRLDPDKVALVFQYNKRDLPDVSSVDEMNEYLQPGKAPVSEAAAIEGKGVTQTLRAAISRILDNLKNNVDVTLYDAPPLHRPVMAVPSGATLSSAGAKKVSIGNAGFAQHPAPPPVAPPPVEFADLNEGSDDVAVETVEPPFLDGPVVAETAAQEQPLEEVAEPPFEETGHFPPDDHASEPFGSSMEEPAPSRAALESVLVSAERLIASLETALVEAQRHRDEILQKLEEISR